MPQKAKATQAVSRNGHKPIPEPDVPDVETDTLSEPEAEAQDTATVPRKKLFVDSDEDLLDESPFLTSCRVQQPPSEIVFRVRPGKAWRAEALVVDYRGDDPRLPRGKYLIVGRMQAKFREFGRKVLLVTCVSSTGEVFLWDVKVTLGFGDSWYKSDLLILKQAETQWVRFIRQAGNAHGGRASKKDHGEPRWPGPEVESIYDLALLAFSGERLVEDESHPLCDIYEIE
jgi:hypothetical protein